jgi:putative transposase
MADTLAACERLRDTFIKRYENDYQKAAERLLADWDRMITFYSFPKEHWVHLRTTNVVESPFSSVRLRTDAAKRFKKVQNATAMIWKLLQVAEKNFRTLKGYWLLSAVYAGKEFVGGVAHESKALERMAAFGKKYTDTEGCFPSVCIFRYLCLKVRLENPQPVDI